jgi:hypothetical protein
MTKTLTPKAAALPGEIQQVPECLVWDIGPSDFELVSDFGFRILSFEFITAR